MFGYVDPVGMQVVDRLYAGVCMLVRAGSRWCVHVFMNANALPLCLALSLSPAVSPALAY